MEEEKVSIDPVNLIDPVELTLYDLHTNPPIILNCGHTIGLTTLQTLTASNHNTCPLCQAEIRGGAFPAALIVRGLLVDRQENPRVSSQAQETERLRMLKRVVEIHKSILELCRKKKRWEKASLAMNIGNAAVKVVGLILTFTSGGSSPATESMFGIGGSTGTFAVRSASLGEQNTRNKIVPLMQEYFDLVNRPTILAVFRQFNIKRVDPTECLTAKYGGAQTLLELVGFSADATYGAAAQFVLQSENSQPPTNNSSPDPPTEQDSNPDLSETKGLQDSGPEMPVSSEPQISDQGLNPNSGLTHYGLNSQKVDSGPIFGSNTLCHPDSYSQRPSIPHRLDSHEVMTNVFYPEQGLQKIKNNHEHPHALDKVDSNTIRKYQDPRNVSQTLLRYSSACDLYLPHQSEISPLGSRPKNNEELRASIEEANAKIRKVIFALETFCPAGIREERKTSIPKQKHEDPMRRLEKDNIKLQNFIESLEGQ